MTFDQHPSVVFKHTDPQQVRYLTTIDQKTALMSELGVDILYVLHFDATVGAMPPNVCRSVDRWLTRKRWLLVLTTRTDRLILRTCNV